MPHSTSSSTPPTPRTAFTLIELLVTIAVIAVLAAVLLPALTSVQTTAKVASCLSNTKQLVLATVASAGDNDQRTPAAAYNNAPASLGGAGNCPNRTQAPVGTKLPATAAGGASIDIEVWEAIGAPLEAYLDANPAKIYRCPAAPDSPDDNWALSGDDPYRGRDPDDVFKPNYFYMSTAHWITLPVGAFGFYPEQWTTRNIADLRLASINQNHGEVTVFVDESTSHHSRSSDIYTRFQQGVTTPDISNFGYLDGHVESKRFNDLRGYFAALSRPIAQRPYGLDITTTPHWEAAKELPDTP